MPTYEYACANCDTVHEVQQKMTDPTLTECPQCGQSGLRKVFNNVGVVFKGSGFYRTDSRGKSSDSTSSTSSSTSSSGSSSSSASSGSSGGSTSSSTSSASSSSSSSGS